MALWRELRAFASDEANGEQGFVAESGSITGEWSRAGAQSMNSTQLEAVADAAGAFEFVRIEDGSFGRSM
jgi:hypothetical protein